MFMVTKQEITLGKQDELHEEKKENREKEALGLCPQEWPLIPLFLSSQETNSNPFFFVISRLDFYHPKKKLLSSNQSQQPPPLLLLSYVFVENLPLFSFGSRGFL